MLAKYPIPIALTYKTKLQQTPSPLHRLFGLTDVFEVTLKYCAIIAIQEYVRLGLHSPEVDEEIALHFRIPSLGSWNAFLREVLRCFRGLQEQLLMPALVNFYLTRAAGSIAKQQQRIDELINLRNRLAHSARRSDEEAEEEFEKHWPLLATVLADLGFLASYDLILHDEDGSGRLLMGTEPKVIELPAAAAAVAARTTVPGPRRAHAAAFAAAAACTLRLSHPPWLLRAEQNFLLQQRKAPARFSRLLHGPPSLGHRRD